MTPSGLSIGTILKTKWSLRTFASGAFDVKKSTIPFIAQLPFDSPGWTLAEMNTPFLLRAFSLLGSLSFEVIVIRSQRLPARVLVSIDLWKKFWLFGFDSIACKSSLKSLYV